MGAPLTGADQIGPIDPLLLELPGEISTPRLTLRPYRPGDGEMYYQALRANWQHLYEFMPYPYLEMQSARDAEAALGHLVEEMHRRNLFIFATLEKDSGSYVGETYLANPDWHAPRIEVGYFIVRSSTGKGYASEAARALLRYAFEGLKVARVELQCEVPDRPRALQHAGRGVGIP